MVGVFVDTSAWYALRVSNDARHREARIILERLLAEKASLHTSDWSLVETTALISNRIGRQEAVRTGEWILSSRAVSVHALGSELGDCWKRYQDAAGRPSLVDCGSFTLMKKLGLSRAFAFDSDFEAEGFNLEAAA